MDRDGIPHWDGNAKFAEEWEERVLLRYAGCVNDQQRKALAPRVKTVCSDAPGI